MALSERVKKLATDAVTGKESTDWIRKHSGDNATGLPARQMESGNVEQARGLALEAVSQTEAMRQIRLVSVNKVDAPLPTPNARLPLVSGRTRMESLWQGSGVAVARDERERDNGR
jgi:hypothetical protein